jgi:hypothetical protein
MLLGALARNPYGYCMLLRLMVARITWTGLEQSARIVTAELITALTKRFSTTTLVRESKRKRQDCK